MHALCIFVSGASFGFVLRWELGELMKRRQFSFDRQL